MVLHMMKRAPLLSGDTVGPQTDNPLMLAAHQSKNLHQVQPGASDTAPPAPALPDGAGAVLGMLDTAAPVSARALPVVTQPAQTPQQQITRAMASETPQQIGAAARMSTLAAADAQVMPAQQAQAAADAGRLQQQQLAEAQRPGVGMTPSQAFLNQYLISNDPNTAAAQQAMKVRLLGGGA